MAIFPFISKKKNKENAVLLDIGTETTKALLLEDDSRKIKVLGSSMEYFDRYGVFDSRDFEADILKKTISKTIESLNKKTDRPIILGLPPTILKARVASQGLIRNNSEKIIDEKEEKKIYQKALEDCKKIISEAYSREFGILASDIQFINLKIQEIKIDGYRVSNIRKYHGRVMDFKVLATFLPKYYLEKMEKIVESAGLKVGSINQEAEGLNVYSQERPDGIFLDIGGSITQVFLTRNGILEKIGEFGQGGQIFSKAISETLGLTEQEARILKERYSRGELTRETSERVKDILTPALQIWFENLKLKLKEITEGNLLPWNIIIFGGASQLPEIKKVLKSGDWKGLLFSGGLDVQIFFPKDKIEREGKFLNNPQEIPSLLMSYAKKSY